MTNTQDAKEKVCLIDGSGYIFRAFFASPQMTNPEGLPVNAVYGFLNMFLSLTASCCLTPSARISATNFSLNTKQPAPNFRPS